MSRKTLKPETMHEEALHFVGDLYDCAIRPELWPHAIEKVIRFVNGIAGIIMISSPAERKFRFSVEVNTNPEYQRRFREEYGSINPMLTFGWFGELDEPTTARLFAGETAFLNSRFYREWAEPQNYGDVLAILFARNYSRYGTLAIAQHVKDGAFRDEQIARMRLIAPHIRRAATIADLLDVKSLRDDMLSSALNMLAVGIVLTDAKGRIVYANTRADEMLSERARIRRDGDHLGARDGKASKEIMEAVTQAASGNTMTFPRCGIAVPIPGNEPLPDLAAWVLPLESGMRAELAAPFAARVAVFLKELGDMTPFPGELFVRRYGITPAECRLLILLTQGMSLSEASEALGISENTAKTQLRQLFLKTGVNRQSDLIRLASTALSPARSQCRAHPE